MSSSPTSRRRPTNVDFFVRLLYKGTRARSVSLPPLPALLRSSASHSSLLHPPPVHQDQEGGSTDRSIDHGRGHLHRHHPRHHPPAPRRLLQVRMRDSVLDLPVAHLPGVHPRHPLRPLHHHSVESRRRSTLYMYTMYGVPS